MSGVRSDCGRSGAAFYDSGMICRGVYRDGVVRIKGKLHWPNGARVRLYLEVEPRVSLTPEARKRSAAEGKAMNAPRKKLSRKKMTKAERRTSLDAAFGMWKDRPEWAGMTSVEILADIRCRSAMRALSD